MELRFAPKAQKKKQLGAAEELLRIVNPEKVYPFEFICFRVTEYRLRTVSDEKLIKGEELAHDLGVFVKKLSGQLALSVDEEQEKISSIEELACRFSVSTKTIGRWRKKGLAGRTYVFEDGKKRLGFLESAVEEFLSANPESVERARKFSQLSSEQKSQIINRASALAGKGKTTRHQVIKKIAGETSRAVETIRLLLIEHEKENPDKPIFKKPAGVINSREAALIYKLYNQSVSIKELTEKFNRSRGSIYRIINQRRTRALVGRKIDFIDSSEFLETGAEENILVGGGEFVSRYVAGKKPGTLLKRDEETELFRRYNYLKYLGCLARTKINMSSPSAGLLNQVEGYLEQAEEIKTIIIEANLRLVVSIAGKHLGTGANMADLVSEGNFSLMRAVEKFDYTRGYRFSTYASWAIAKDFARKIPAETSRPDKPTTGDLSNIQKDMRIADMVDIAAVENAHRSLGEVITNNLTEREQYVIRSHFGLEQGTVRKKPATLKQIGKELNLSKERVRQIELMALQKLRHSLSPEQFDLLTG